MKGLLLPIITLIFLYGNSLSAMDKDSAVMEKKRSLMSAVLQRKIKTVRKLLKEGVNPNFCNSYGTPLERAAQNGDATCVRELLDNNADPNLDTNSKKSPLHPAASQGHLECVKDLLYYGADCNAKDNNGFTPLNDAIFSNHLDCVRELLSHGAHHSPVDNFSTIPLITAASHYDFFGPTNPEDIETILKLLLDAGANPNFACQKGETALMNAASSSKPKRINILLKAGAKPHIKDKDGKTALHYACCDINYSAHPECIPVLLQAGINIDETDNMGRTPLHAAAISQNSGCLRELLKRGADHRLRDNDGATPLDLAKSKVDEWRKCGLTPHEEGVAILLKAEVNSLNPNLS